MAFSEDFSVFINDDTPGYKTVQIEYQDVSGILDKDYEETNFVESSNPVFWVESSDISNITQGCLLVDGDFYYDIIGIEDDGSGITKLELRMKYDS